jgi:dienelactone hydrolase
MHATVMRSNECAKRVLVCTLGLAAGCASDAADDGGTDGASTSESTAADDGSGPGSATLEDSADGSESGSASADDAPQPTTSGGSSDDGTDTGSFPEPVPDDCITEVTPGHHAFVCDGLTYDVEVPDTCLDMACGMVFDVHGYTMSAQMEEANTGLRALGQRYGYIVVQPNAEPDPPAASWSAAIDDPKVFDFMQRVAAAWHVDPDRWHFTGFSQGGFMSWRFICDHADVLASVAPGAACDGAVAFGDCSFMGEEVPSEPIDILYLHGTSDALINFGCAGPRRDAVVAHFGLGEEEVVQEDDDHRWTRHTSDEATFEFIEHDYAAATAIIAGHCFPGSQDESGAPGQLFSFACVEPNAFVWGDAVMQFFVDHPRG